MMRPKSCPTDQTRIQMSEPAQANNREEQQTQKNTLPNKRPKSGWVLDPSGSIYHDWSIFVSLAFLYNFWSLSYRFAFREIDQDTMLFWFILDYSADLIYLLDVVINLHTGYLEDGVLVRELPKIGLHYRECTRFYLDCFCLLPLDVLYLSIGPNSILRITRLVKIYKFWSCVDRTERHTNYPNVFRTFTLVHYILVIFHWNACLFHMIAKNKLIDIESLYKASSDDQRCDDILCQYLHAFYWSTQTMTLIGDLPRPKKRAEYLYVIFELLVGLFVFASVLGHVANIVTNVSAARKEFQAKLDSVKTYMRMRRVSDELQNKVIRWFDYLWTSQQSSDEDKSVACLPDKLKAEIAIHVHLDTLKRVDIFQNTEAGFLCELVLRLRPVLFSPGDFVCRKNEVGLEMYIVSRGILEVLAEDENVRGASNAKVVATLSAGSYFGEISVLNVGLAGNKRTASVRSVGYSDLFCLNKRDLWDVLKNHPNAEARIRARAEERLSKLDMKKPLRSAAIKAQQEQLPQHQRICKMHKNTISSQFEQHSNGHAGSGSGSAMSKRKHQQHCFSNALLSGHKQSLPPECCPLADCPSEPASVPRWRYASSKTFGSRGQSNLCSRYECQKSRHWPATDFRRHHQQQPSLQSKQQLELSRRKHQDTCISNVGREDDDDDLDLDSNIGGGSVRSQSSSSVASSALSSFSSLSWRHQQRCKPQYQQNFFNHNQNCNHYEEGSFRHRTNCHRRASQRGPEQRKQTQSFAPARVAQSSKNSSALVADSCRSEQYDHFLIQVPSSRRLVSSSQGSATSELPSRGRAVLNSTRSRQCNSAWQFEPQYLPAAIETLPNDPSQSPQQPQWSPQLQPEADLGRQGKQQQEADLATGLNLLLLRPSGLLLNKTHSQSVSSNDLEERQLGPGLALGKQLESQLSNLDSPTNSSVSNTVGKPDSHELTPGASHPGSGS